MKRATIVMLSLALAVALLGSVRAQTPPPAAPSELQAVVVHDALLITLLWQDNADSEDAYVVEQSTEGEDGPWSVIATLPADSADYSDSGLEDETTYWYRVAAMKGDGLSAYSNIASGTATALPTPVSYFIGDVNCDGGVDAIDAALVLQLEAGLLQKLPCPDNADPNNDGVTNSLDASLVLQQNAGLTHGPFRMVLNVHRPEGLCDHPDTPTTCDIPVASEFGLAISLHNPPPQGYTAFQTQLFYGGLRYNPTAFADEEIPWPDLGIALRGISGVDEPSGTEGDIGHGGLTSSFRISDYRGNLVEISMTCTVQAGSFTVVLQSVAPGPGQGAGSALILAENAHSGILTAPKIFGQRDLDVNRNGTIEPWEADLYVAAVLEINCVEPAP